MVERINTHVMRRLGTTRRALFEAVERAALLPLPVVDNASPHGGWPGSISTTTSRLPAFFTRCPAL